MRKSVFAIDASPHAYIGYTSGRLWNGWATPYFTFEEAQKLQAEFSQGANSPMLYDVNKDEFRLKYDGDDEPYLSTLHYMYRYADNEKDYTGYRNRWAKTIDELASAICTCLHKMPTEVNDRRI